MSDEARIKGRCTECKRLSLEDSGTCPTCGAAIEPVLFIPNETIPPELLDAKAGNVVAMSARGPKTLETTEQQPGGRDAPTTIDPYTPAEFQETLKNSKCWNVERLVKTVQSLGAQLHDVAVAGAEAQKSNAINSAALAVLLRRQGGSVTIREKELNELHPRFSVGVTELPATKAGKVLAVGYLVPKESIQVVGAIPAGLNGRRQ